MAEDKDRGVKFEFNVSSVPPEAKAKLRADLKKAVQDQLAAQRSQGNDADLLHSSIHSSIS